MADAPCRVRFVHEGGGQELQRMLSAIPPTKGVTTTLEEGRLSIDIEADDIASVRRIGDEVLRILALIEEEGA